MSSSTGAADRAAAVQWCGASTLPAMATVVLVGALAILVVVMLWPTASYVAQGFMVQELNVSLLLEAHNDADHSAVTFSQLEIRLLLTDLTVAVVRAEPFRVRAGGTLPLPPFVASARNFPLSRGADSLLYAAFNNNSDNHVHFVLDGDAITHRYVAGRIAVNQRTRLTCHVHSFLPNGTAVRFKCRSETKYLFW